jgi:hypothetical protein
MSKPAPALPAGDDLHAVVALARVDGGKTSS